MKKFLVLLMIASLLVVAQGPVPISNPCEFISWLMTSAGVNLVVLGPILSLLVEYWPMWEGLTHKKKRPIMFGLCLVVPAVGLLAGCLLCGIPLTIDTVWSVIVAGLSAYAGSSFTHIRMLPDGSR